MKKIVVILGIISLLEFIIIMISLERPKQNLDNKYIIEYSKCRSQYDDLVNDYKLYQGEYNHD